MAKIDYKGLPCPTCKEDLSYYTDELLYRCANGHTCDTAPEPVAVDVSSAGGSGLDPLKRLAGNPDEFTDVLLIPSTFGAGSSGIGRLDEATRQLVAEGQARMEEAVAHGVEVDRAMRDPKATFSGGTEIQHPLMVVDQVKIPNGEKFRPGMLLETSTPRLATPEEERDLAAGLASNPAVSRYIPPAEPKPNGDVLVSILILERQAMDLRAMAEMQGLTLEEFTQREFQRCLDNEWFGR